MLCRKYVTINDIDQRRQYKADFQKSYIEYKNLEKQVYPVSEAFKKLAERLKQHEKGSPEFTVSFNAVFLSNS